MKILLLGHKGYLGSYLFQHLEVDVLDMYARTAYDNNENYDVVINCVGKPDLEYCEAHPEETEYSNHLVLKDIKKFYPEAKIINFSSYYVYDDEGLCTENAKTTMQYNYCRQKFLGEKEVTNGVSFRLGKLFGNPHASQNKLTEYIIANDHLILDSVLFNPTSVRQVLTVVKYELEHKILSGIYNLSNSGVVTHYDYGKYIEKLLKKDKHIKKVDKMTRNFHNYGRFAMSVEKLNNIIPLTLWEEDMEIYLRTLYPSRP